MGNRLSKIYTRTGDDGTTGLGDGSRIDKDSLRVEAFGSVDELNSATRSVRWQTLKKSIAGDARDCWPDIQQQLFDLGGELCIPGATVITE